MGVNWSRIGVELESSSIVACERLIAGLRLNKKPFIDRGLNTFSASYGALLLNKPQAQKGT